MYWRRKNISTTLGPLRSPGTVFSGLRKTPPLTCSVSSAAGCENQTSCSEEKERTINPVLSGIYKGFILSSRCSFADTLDSDRVPLREQARSISTKKTQGRESDFEGRNYSSFTSTSPVIKIKKLNRGDLHTMASHSYNSFRQFSQGRISEQGYDRKMNFSGQRRKRGEYDIPGGVIQKFDSIPSSLIDPHAETHVENFLMNSKQLTKASQITVFDVPKSTLKRAVLAFTVNSYSALAIGQSTRNRVAKTLCCMHASALIDYFSVSKVPGTCTKEEMERIMQLAPPPKCEIPSKRALSNEQNCSREAQNNRFQSSVPPPPCPDNFSDWNDYVSECNVYAASRKKDEVGQYYLQMKIPPSGNPLVDNAAQLIEAELRGGATDFSSLHRINKELPNLSNEILVNRFSAKIYVASVVLDPSANITAKGVAPSNKEARQRCAMHALKIMDLMKQQREIVAKGISTSPRSSVGPDPRSPSRSVVDVLSPRYGKLFDFFRFLFDDESIEISFSKEEHHFVCQIKVSDAEGSGRGLNRMDAERSAVENVLSTLELYDSRIQELNTFICSHPTVVAQGIPTVRLPPGFDEKVKGFVQHYESVFKTSDGLGGKSSLMVHNAPLVPDQGKTNDTEVEVTVKSLQGISLDPVYAESMITRLERLRTDPAYVNNFHHRRSTLAIANVKEELLKKIESNRVLIVCGTTGCGKTTQVPQYILDNEIINRRGDQCSIIVTQPRRISAFSVAERIASERLSATGGDIGYAVRLEARPGRHITLCTTGVLLQMLSNLPHLENVSHLIIDEVHERDINCDVLLALAKQVMLHNKHIRLILMSATLQADLFSSYFDGAPIIQVEGAVYPVKELYLEDIKQAMMQEKNNNFYSPMFNMLDSSPNSKYGGQNSSYRNQRWSGSPSKPMIDYHLLAQLVLKSFLYDMHGNAEGKSILVFLPGWKELLSARNAIDSLRCGVSFHIILLHSSVDISKQRECFSPSPKGTVKVVLATNIAESGITIDDAAVVIDTGLIKQASWSSRTAQRPGNSHSWGADPHVSSFSTQLSLCFASKANCIQRKGRAGRTQGGVCYRLFTRQIWNTLPQYQEAEIHRISLMQVLLKLLSLGYSRPRDTLQTFVEPPSTSNVRASMQQLKDLGAVNAEEQLTTLGLYLSKLPCDPRIGKMIMMGALLNCLDSVLTMAATADVSPFLTNRETIAEVRRKMYAFSRGSQSDHISFLNAFNSYCAHNANRDYATQNYLHFNNMNLISRYKEQYRDVLRLSGFITESDLQQSVTYDNIVSSTLSPFEEPDITDQPFRDSGSPTSPVSGSTLFVDSSVLSHDSLDVSLVKACLCSALFPNVAVLDRAPFLRGKKVTKLSMRTKAGGIIAPSKDSSCRRLGGPRANGPQARKQFFNQEKVSDQVDPSSVPAMYYLYQGIFTVREARQDFLTQVSSVSLWALLLFGAGDANLIFYNDIRLCLIDGWIAIKMDSSTFDVIHKLRSGLHECVWRKYKQPENSENNHSLSVLRELCKEILKAPLNEKDQYVNRLVDCGSISSPFTVTIPSPTELDEMDDEEM